VERCKPKAVHSEGGGASEISQKVSDAAVEDNTQSSDPKEHTHTHTHTLSAVLQTYKIRSNRNR